MGQPSPTFVTNIDVAVGVVPIVTAGIVSTLKIDVGRVPEKHKNHIWKAIKLKSQLKVRSRKGL